MRPQRDERRGEKGWGTVRDKERGERWVLQYAIPQRGTHRKDNSRKEAKEDSMSKSEKKGT